MSSAPESLKVRLEIDEIGRAQHPVSAAIFAMTREALDNPPPVRPQSVLGGPTAIHTGSAGSLLQGNC